MSAHKEGDPTTLNRLYGRSQGKPLRAAQQELVDKLLPQIAVPEEGPVTAERLFGFDRPLHFEIGFGAGEHLAYRADMLPDHGFIGAEPFLNGVAQALMNDGPVRMIADKLKPGGEFRFGTDHPIYLRHALMVMRRFTDEFEWLVDGRQSWENRPSGWCETRYEHKARNTYGHEVWYFRFRRK